MREIPLYNPVGPDPCVLTMDGATHTEHGRSLLCPAPADIERHASRILSRMGTPTPEGMFPVLAVAPWSAAHDTACIDVVLYAPPGPNSGGEYRYIIASEGTPSSRRAVNSGGGISHGWHAHLYTRDEIERYLRQYGIDATIIQAGGRA